MDTTTPGGRLVFHVFAALAEFIRELIVSGSRGGLGRRPRSGWRAAHRCHPRDHPGRPR
ncbi:recombinase family protein [Streptomyces californicus]|uniref:recombinase family protein n=1 Tax=Streptomyces californicus TaxID=67351 RepID=UPI00367630CD